MDHYIAGRFVDVGNSVWIYLVAEDVTIFVVAVEPKIGRLEVFVVDKFTFDLEIGEMIVDAPILPSFRPIPENLGRVLKCHCRDVTGLASYSRKMRVDSLVFVLLVHMALFAGNLFFWVNCVIVRDHSTQDLMILGLVTIGALHIKFAAHMNVVVLGREIEALVEVAMLDAIPAAAIEVTFATIFAGRGAY